MWKPSLRILITSALLIGLMPALQGFTSATCSWKQTFNDTFDSGTLNTALWSTQYPSGNGGELQAYTSDAIYISNSHLHIHATATPTNGYAYKSGIIITRGKFAQEYGKFKVRVWLPKGQGYWPAFWLLPETPKFPDEIDGFESFGQDPHTVYLSNHWMGTDGTPQHKTVTYTSSSDFSAGFHTFTVEWSPTTITWYVDGAAKYTTHQNIPHEPMFILVNLAVGGHWPGNPDATTKFPGVMSIDFVRAYKKVCSAP
jgi:beta-glucanase (GH16 family)